MGETEAKQNIVLEKVVRYRTVDDLVVEVSYDQNRPKTVSIRNDSDQTVTIGFNELLALMADVKSHPKPYSVGFFEDLLGRTPLDRAAKDILNGDRAQMAETAAE